MAKVVQSGKRIIATVIHPCRGRQQIDRPDGCAHRTLPREKHRKDTMEEENLKKPKLTMPTMKRKPRPMRLLLPWATPYHLYILQLHHPWPWSSHQTAVVMPIIERTLHDVSKLTKICSITVNAVYCVGCAFERTKR